MGQIWDFLIIKPFSWLLSTFTTLTGSYGLAIILFALIAKVILLYFSARGKRSMMQTQRIQPKIKELEAKYRNDKVKYQQAVSELYKKEGVSMTGGCLWSLLPFPILIALYSVIQRPFTNLMGLASEQIDKLAQIVTNAGGTIPAANDPFFQLKLSESLHPHFAQAQAALPGANLIDVNYNFLGLNLSQTPTLSFSWLILIPLLSGLTAFFAMRLTQKLTATTTQQQSQPGGKFMSLLMPGLSLYFAFIMPALMGIYWIANNVFGAVQDYYLTKYYLKVFEVEDAKKAEFEARRKAAEDAMKKELRERKAAEIEEKKKKRKPGTSVYKLKNKPTSAKSNKDDEADEE